MARRIIDRSISYIAFAALTLCALSSCTSNEDQTPITKSITIRLVLGPELRAYMTAMEQQFELQQPKLADGSRVLLDFINEAGMSAAHAIANGELKTEAWLAPSSALVNYANQTVKNLGARQRDCVQLFGTPIVIAVPTDLQSSVGAHDQQYDWTKLQALIAGSDTATVKVRFSHGDLQDSVSGFGAVLQLAQFAGGSQNWSDALAQQLKAYETHASQYSSRESYLLDRTAQSVPMAVRVTLTTEQQVILHNRRRAAGAPALSALYPDHDAVWQDYMLCQSDAEWVTPAEHAAMKKFQEFLSSDSAQSAVGAYGLRPSIIRRVNPEDFGPQSGVNAALPASSATPASAEFATRLLSQWDDLARPIAIALVADLSGSMQGASLRGLKDAFRGLLARLPKTTRAELISFASEAKVEAPFSANLAGVVEALDGLQAVGGSALYDGIRFAVDSASAPELAGYRREVIVITDGEGKNSDITLGALTAFLNDRLRQNDLNLMIVGIKGTDPYADLASIGRDTGAVFRDAAPGDLVGTLQDILKDL